MTITLTVTGPKFPHPITLELSDEVEISQVRNMADGSVAVSVKGQTLPDPEFVAKHAKMFEKEKTPSASSGDRYPLMRPRLENFITKTPKSYGDGFHEDKKTEIDYYDGGTVIKKLLHGTAIPGNDERIYEKEVVDPETGVKSMVPAIDYEVDPTRHGGKRFLTVTLEPYDKETRNV